MAIAGHDPNPTVGGMHYHRQRASPAIIETTREARPRLLIRGLLMHVLVVPPSGNTKK
ncbi:hypothetical protein AVEN_2768-1, partial [Araneus ventricosus]